MYKQINEPNYLRIQPESDNYYFLICNIQDKKLSGKRNDSLINILYKANTDERDIDDDDEGIVDDDGGIVDDDDGGIVDDGGIDEHGIVNDAKDNISNFINNELFSKPRKLGTVIRYKNIFFCFTMITGGKPGILDTRDMRIENLIKCILYIKETVDLTGTCAGTGAGSGAGTSRILFCDYSNIIIDPHADILIYKKTLSILCKEHNININVIVNTKVKLLEKNMFVEKKEPDIDITKVKFISDIYFTEADLYYIS
jgi:hypothetical protein